MAKRTILYFEGIYHRLEEIPQDVKNTLTKILQGEYAAVTLKSIGSSLYSARVNDADRLIFTIYENKLLLLEIIRQHAYQKAKFVNPQAEKRLQAFISEQGFSIEDGPHEEDVKALELQGFTDEVEEVEYKAVHPSPGGIIELSNEQRAILDTGLLHLPAVIIGEAGTGKSTLSLALLVEWLNQHQEEVKASNAKVLYLASAKEFLHEIKNFFHNEVLCGVKENVQFMTYAEWVADLHPELRQTAEFAQFLEREIKKNKDLKFLADLGFDTCLLEARLISGCKSLQMYADMGKKMSLLVTGDETDGEILRKKQLLWDTFHKYIASLQNEVDLTYSAITRKAKTPYALVVIEEGHLLSGAELNNIISFAANEQIIAVTDAEQREFDKRFNQAAFLKQVMPNLTEYHLTKPFRCPHEVQVFINQWREVRYQVNPNSPHKHYKKEQVNLAASSGVVQVQEKPDEVIVHQLLAAGDCIIITQAALVDKIRAQYNTKYVFTAEDVIGLQFRYVIMLDVIENKRLRLIEEKLHATTSLKHSDDCDVLERDFSEIYISASRVMQSGKLYFYQTAIMRCHELLKSLETWTGSSSLPLNVVMASTERKAEIDNALKRKGLLSEEKPEPPIPNIQKPVAAIAAKKANIDALKINLVSNFTPANLTKTFDWLLKKDFSFIKQVLFNKDDKYEGVGAGSIIYLVLKNKRKQLELYSFLENNPKYLDDFLVWLILDTVKPTNSHDAVPTTSGTRQVRELSEDDIDGEKIFIHLFLTNIIKHYKNIDFIYTVFFSLLRLTPRGESFYLINFNFFSALLFSNHECKQLIMYFIFTFKEKIPADGTLTAENTALYHFLKLHNSMDAVLQELVKAFGIKSKKYADIIEEFNELLTLKDEDNRFLVELVLKALGGFTIKYIQNKTIIFPYKPLFEVFNTIKISQNNILENASLFSAYCLGMYMDSEEDYWQVRVLETIFELDRDFVAKIPKHIFTNASRAVTLDSDGKAKGVFYFNVLNILLQLPRGREFFAKILDRDPKGFFAKELYAKDFFSLCADWPDMLTECLHGRKVFSMLVDSKEFVQSFVNQEFISDGVALNLVANISMAISKILGTTTGQSILYKIMLINPDIVKHICLDAEVGIIKAEKDSIWDSKQVKFFGGTTVTRAMIKQVLPYTNEGRKILEMHAEYVNSQMSQANLATQS